MGVPHWQAFHTVDYLALASLRAWALLTEEQNKGCGGSGHRHTLSTATCQA